MGGMDNSSVLAHWTENTGHLRMSPRSEVPNEALELLAPVLGAALEGETPVIPGFGYWLQAWSNPKKLRFEILAAPDGLALAQVRVTPAHGEAWPKCCVYLEHDTLSEYPDVTAWLGDVACRLAWCWL